MRRTHNDEGRGENNQRHDERGRFMSNRPGSRGRSEVDDEDERGHRSAQRGDWGIHYYDETDGYRSEARDDREQGRGGWFGDREGHAEAARGRGRYDENAYDDDYSRSSRGREQGQGFDDSEGYGASRGGRGPVGGRSRYDHDEGDHHQSRGRSMHGSRSVRSPGGQSQGRGRGWFGDSQGHAEAGRHSHDYD